MSLRLLLQLGIISFFLFIAFTFLVAKEFWSQIDFDSMVKLQDKIPVSLDPFLSVFSFLGGAEITGGISLLFSAAAFFKKNLLAAIGWLGIIPATIIEVIGKMTVYHPAPSIEFLRTIETTDLPRFYVHTEYSYPSGHVTRTTYLIVIAMILIWTKVKSTPIKWGLLVFSGLILFLMIVSRVSLGEHWLSDVIGGIILGASAAFISAIFILGKIKKG